MIVRLADLAETWRRLASYLVPYSSCLNDPRTKARFEALMFASKQHADALAEVRRQIEAKIADAKAAMLQARAEGDEEGDDFHEGRMSAYSGALALLTPAEKETT